MFSVSLIALQIALGHLLLVASPSMTLVLAVFAIVVLLILAYGIADH
jgi:hypothetical protein